MEFFYANGPDGYRSVAAVGLPLFLDLKLHDIPNTVAGAVRSLTPLAPAFLTIHTAGGPEMMKAAAAAAYEAAEKHGVTRPRLLGVTVLTRPDARSYERRVGDESVRHGKTRGEQEHLKKKN